MRCWDPEFPWTSIWKTQGPHRVAFFIWTVALGKILIKDNLRRQGVIIVDWCSMCKSMGELWSPVFCLFGVSWVMLNFVINLLASSKGNFCNTSHGEIWVLVPLCLMWCLWRERNSCFEGTEILLPQLKFLFLKTLVNTPFSSHHLLDVLDDTSSEY